MRQISTYIATSEVTALEHECRDHTVKLGTLIAKAFLAGAEGTEVLSGLGNDVIIESEIDSASLGCNIVSVSLHSLEAQIKQRLARSVKGGTHA